MSILTDFVVQGPGTTSQLTSTTAPRSVISHHLPRRTCRIASPSVRPSCLTVTHEIPTPTRLFNTSTLHPASTRQSPTASSRARATPSVNSTTTTARDLPFQIHHSFYSSLLLLTACALPLASPPRTRNIHKPSAIPWTFKPSILTYVNVTTSSYKRLATGGTQCSWASS